MTPEDIKAFLSREMKAWDNTDHRLYCQKTLDFIESQAARIRELERDAARYRWLRERGTSATLPRVYAGDPVEAVMWDALDAAIDAAMQAAREPTQPPSSPPQVPHP